MAQSRPRTTTDPTAALGREITKLQRKVRELELRPDPVASGGSSVYCYASYDDGGSVIIPYYTASSQVVWPIDTIVAQSGGFALGAASGRFSAPGGYAYSISVPEAGLYRVHFNALLDRLTFTGAAAFVRIENVFNGTFDTSGTPGLTTTFVMVTDDVITNDGATDYGNIYIEAEGQFLASTGPFEIWVEGVNLKGFDKTGSTGPQIDELELFGLGGGTEYSLLIERIDA